MTLFVALLFACGAPETPTPTLGAPEPTPALDHLRRASLALRGHPAHPDEVRAVHQGTPWTDVVTSWRSDPYLGEVAANVVAEAFGLRHDAQPHVPSLGPLASVPPATVIDRLDEAPLRLVAHIVNTGRPFTEIVTTDEMLADGVVSAAYGPVIDAGSTDWQVSVWPDGRPAAGILSSTTLMQRHPIAPTNHQRSRAAIVAEALLCDDYAERPEAGTVRPVQQDDALWTDPVCLSCHASLDPLAANFEGFRRYILASEVDRGYRTDCAEGFCYPLALYDPDVRLAPPGALPDPGFYGTPTVDLAEVGAAIAADRRFPTCTVRRFFGHLVGLDWADVEGDFVRELADRFVASDHDAAELLLAMVVHPAFAPASPHAPPSFLRPRQWVRTLDHLVQVRATALPNGGFGVVDLVTTDRFGLNQVMGGVEGWRRVPADRAALPSRELAWRWLAEEAAAMVMARGDERWFPAGHPMEGPEARAMLAEWHLRVLGEVREPDEPVIDADLAALSALSVDRGPEVAWAALLAGFLQHPRLVVQ